MSGCNLGVFGPRRWPPTCAKQAKDTDLIEKATEIRVRAERRAGEMLAQTEKATGARMNGKASNGASVVTDGNRREAATLAEIGITKKQSSHYQQLAAMPEEHFETAEDTTAIAVGRCDHDPAAVLREPIRRTRGGDDIPPGRFFWWERALGLIGAPTAPQLRGGVGGL